MVLKVEVVTKSISGILHKAGHSLLLSSMTIERRRESRQNDDTQLDHSLFSCLWSWRRARESTQVGSAKLFPTPPGLLCHATGRNGQPELVLQEWTTEDMGHTIFFGLPRSQRPTGLLAALFWPPGLLGKASSPVHEEASPWILQ